MSQNIRHRASVASAPGQQLLHNRVIHPASGCSPIGTLLGRIESVIGRVSSGRPEPECQQCDDGEDNNARCEQQNACLFVDRSSLAHLSNQWRVAAMARSSIATKVGRRISGRICGIFLRVLAKIQPGDTNGGVQWCVSRMALGRCIAECPPLMHQLYETDAPVDSSNAPMEPYASQYSFLVCLQQPKYLPVHS